MSIAVSLGLTAILFWLTMRWSLLWLLAASLPFLLWTGLRRPRVVKRWSVAVLVLAAIVALAPADVRVQRSGRVSIAVKPVLWGLPTREAMEQIEPGSVVWGGCVMPVNPPRYAVLVSW